MSQTAKAIIGFALAAGVLLVIADYSPKLALGTAGVIAVGVAFTHADQIATALNGFASATGH